ncbi:SMP-30/gluconolactonase/LRE family protein [Nocardia sp. NPDC020380]|uniref:SMP-30/gluconolactonase/LRE family protein n=1 Tax=Nocardia sp. NPDC020380 TaxID=3364309 RepID=UPI0037AE2018
MSDFETLVTGRGLVESPRWHDGRLYFADWSSGEVLATDLAGHTETVARVDSLPLCLAWHPDGDLIIVDSPKGQLLRHTAAGDLALSADLGKPGWNDIIIDGRGNTYSLNGRLSASNTDPARPQPISSTDCCSASASARRQWSARSMRPAASTAGVELFAS